VAAHSIQTREQQKLHRLQGNSFSVTTAAKMPNMLKNEQTGDF